MTMITSGQTGAKMKHFYTLPETFYPNAIFMAHNKTNGVKKWASFEAIFEVYLL